MADAPGSLNDFFAKKKKKNIKGSNLNNEAAPKVEDQKKATKGKEEDGWEEEQITVTSIKVEAAGKLTREDDKKEEEDTSAPAWRTSRPGGECRRDDLTAKKYPSLAKAVGQSSNINIDDGTDGRVNIKTSKNAFAAFGDSDEDEGPKRPKEIRPAMIQKVKGEKTAVAVQREVEKYGGAPAAADSEKKQEGGKKKKKKKVDSDSDSDSDSDEDAPQEKTRKKKEKAAEPAKAPEKKVEEDQMIEPDLEESRKKYQGRTKLPKKELPRSELEEEKEIAKPSAQAQQGGGKKKKKFNAEEEVKPKLQYADWD